LCHPREGEDPFRIHSWIPVFTGMTENRLTKGFKRRKVSSGNQNVIYHELSINVAYRRVVVWRRILISTEAPMVPLRKKDEKKDQG
jgi:hypothetical protein